MPAGASRGRGFGVDRRIIPVAAQRTWRALKNGSDTRNAHLPGCTRCKHRIGVCGRAPRQAPLDTTCHPPAHAGLSRYRPRPHGPQGDVTDPVARPGHPNPPTTPRRAGAGRANGKASKATTEQAKPKPRHAPAPASSDTGPHGARGRNTTRSPAVETPRFRPRRDETDPHLPTAIV